MHLDKYIQLKINKINLLFEKLSTVSCTALFLVRHKLTSSLSVISQRLTKTPKGCKFIQTHQNYWNGPNFYIKPKIIPSWAFQRPLSKSPAVHQLSFILPLSCSLLVKLLLLHYCTFNIFKKVMFFFCVFFFCVFFCLALYTEELNLQTFVMV